MKRLVVSAFVLSLVAAGLPAGAQAPVFSPRPGSGGETLVVGPGKVFERPSGAALAARPGDTIQILPGRYVDCAVWTASGITIEGKGDGVTIADETCEGKAIFVIVGNDVTVRNITFTGAHVRTHNGAGIRAEGTNLTVEKSRFVDNDEGILAGSNPAGAIAVRDSYFRGNGNCIAACAHGIYVGRIALLHVEHSEFVAQHVGHHIKSRALRTEIVDNRIQDGPDGSSSYLLDLPNGGAILISGNRFEKGAKSRNRGTAISIGAEQTGAAGQTGRIDIVNNSFANDVGQPTVFVRNHTSTPAYLQANRFTGTVVPLSGPGTVDGKAVSPN